MRTESGTVLLLEELLQFDLDPPLFHGLLSLVALIYLRLQLLSEPTQSSRDAVPWKEGGPTRGLRPFFYTANTAPPSTCQSASMR